MKHRIAVYAGSFDPPTRGHLDIIHRASLLFDELHIVVAVNSRKTPFFTAPEKIKLLEECVQKLNLKCKIVVASFEGLIVEYCEKAKSQVLIRGLRALSDFESEFQMASMNRHLNEKVETLHMMTDEKYFFLSSSIVKELAYLKTNLEDLVPSNVAKALKAKVRKK